MESTGRRLGISGWRQHAVRSVMGTAYWALATLCAFGSPCAARAAKAAEINEDLRIVVHVVNLANIDKATLAYAERETVRILRDVGMEIDWINCPVSRNETAHDFVCGHTGSSVELVMRIVAQFNGNAWNSPTFPTLGFAVVPDRPGRGTLATISWQGVMTMTAKKYIAPYVVLGHAMAHEIGHLLLGKPEHTKLGLMRAVWDSTDLQRAALHRLNFSPQEAETIRAEARARVIDSTAATITEIAMSR